VDKFKVQADKLEKALTHESPSAEKHAKRGFGRRSRKKD